MVARCGVRTTWHTNLVISSRRLLTFGDVRQRVHQHTSLRNSSNYCRYGLIASTSHEAPLTFFLYSSTLRHTWTTSLQAFPRHSRSPGDLWKLFALASRGRKDVCVVTWWVNVWTSLLVPSSGDPNLELDEVSVPKSITMNLTYPERGTFDLFNLWHTVTPYNIAYLQELVRNGPQSYPGARYVVRDMGERIDLRYNKRADAFLQYGWVVERHLKDGE